MLKRLWNFLTGKCEKPITPEYQYPEAIQKFIPHQYGMMKALDFARWVEDTLGIKYTEVEIILFILGCDQSPTRKDIESYMLHISEEHTHKLLRLLERQKLIIKDKNDQCDTVYKVTDATKYVISRYT